MNGIVPVVLAFRLFVGGPQPDRDAWLAEDKLRHFFMSFAVTQLAYGGARLAGLERDAGLGVAAGVALATGIGKEVSDLRRGRPFSGRDLVWDAGGVAAGVGLGLATR